MQLDDVPELAAQAEPDTEVTAAPETVETETPEEQQAEPEAPKTFTQEELDAILGKRLAIEQRKWERQQARLQQAPASAPVQPGEALQPDDFPSVDAYLDAVADRKAEEKLVQRAAQEQERQLTDAYAEREEAAREKYDDFEQVAYNRSLPITEDMATAIRLSDNGPDVIYWLGQNPKRAAEISALHPLAQAREIGKIEMSLTAAPPVKKTTTAPAPIAPVTARANGAPVYDTTDYRSIKSMTTSEWIEADRLRQIKKYEAQRNR